MKEWVKYLGLPSALLSAVLLVLAFYPFGESVLGWVCLVPLIWVLHARAVTWWQVWITGTLAWIGQLWWLSYVTWLGMIALCVYLGLYLVVWGRWMVLVFNLFPRRSSLGNLASALLGAIGWAALEELRGWLFTGFPWNGLGVSQYANLALIQIAAVGGVELLSALMIFIQVILTTTALRLVAEVQQRRRMLAHWEFTGGLAVLVVAFLYGVISIAPVKNDPDVSTLMRVGLVQGNVPQEVKFSPMSLEDTVAAYTEPTRLIAASEPDLVIWPETATGYGIFQDRMIAFRVMELLEETAVTLLAGSVDVGDDGKLFNAAFLLKKDFDYHAVRASAYRKQHLVVFGEFVPGREWMPWLAEWIDMPVDYHPGRGHSGIMPLPAAYGTVPAGILICFEDLMPRLARARSLAGARVFVNLTNDGWFRDSPAAMAHAAHAVFRCVENRLPMIRSTNTGVSCVIGPDGTFLHIMRDDAGQHTAISGVLLATVKIPPRPDRLTIYQQGGHLFGEICALVMAGVFVVYLRIRFSSARKDVV